MSISSQLAKLRRRRQDSNESHRKSVAASLNKYGKVVQQSFQQGLVSRAELIRKREERENRQQSLREQFATATSNVLSKDTLAFLREQSNIAAPTLTSIFAGYESARADRANRFEAVLDRRQEGLQRIEAADELAFRDQAQARQQQLATQGNILNTGVATQNALFASDNQGIATEARFANTEIEQQFRQEEAVKAREHTFKLQEQRDKLAQQRQTESNKQALARLDRQIAAADTRARIAAEKAATLQAQQIAAADKRQKTGAALAIEQEKLKQQNELKQIEARTDSQVRVRQTPTSAQSGASTPNLSILDQLRTGRFTRPAADSTTDSTSVAPVGDTPTQVEEDPVVEGGTEPIVTESAADNPVIDAAPIVVPEPVAVPEPVTVDDAPGVPVDLSQVSEDPVGDATQLLSSVLQDRNPDALANLGDDVTLDQLAAFFTDDDEEDAEVLKALDTFRSINQTRVV